MKKRVEDVFVHFRTEVADENGVFRTTFFAAVENKVSTLLGYSWDIMTNLLSARPPPDAQLSLKGRLELGIRVPFNCSALAAASVLAKSTKQYPALLLDEPWSAISCFEGHNTIDVPGEFVANHLHVDLFVHAKPHTTHKILINPRLELAHPGIGIST